MNKIAKYLNEHIAGSAFSADRILEAYSTDRSVLKIKPKAVAIPSSTSDIRKILRFADQLAIRKVHVPVAVRGSGRGKTGACLTPGIVLSMERINQISEIDVRQRLVRCQAGVTLGQLNSALALHGLAIPISADPEESIGGLISSAGIYDPADKTPTLRTYLEKAEFILPSGDMLQSELITPKMLVRNKAQRTRTATLYRDLADLIADHRDLIDSELRTTPILPTGYASLALTETISGAIDLTPLLFSSQGTLAVITEVILRCDFLTDPPTYFFATFRSITAAQEFASKAAELSPTTLDLYDLSILNQADAGKTLQPLPSSTTKTGYLLAISLQDLKHRKRRSKLRSLTTLAGDTATAISTPDTLSEFTELHSILLAYLNDTPRTTRLPLCDGAYVPTDKFADYLAGLKSLEEKHHTTLAVFGSCLTSTYSVRPEVNLSSVTGRQFVLAFLRDYQALLSSIGGSLAGDAPEGRTQAIATAPATDPELAKLYTELKEIFDPHNVLGAGIKHDVNLRSVIHSLRTSYNSGIIT